MMRNARRAVNYNLAAQLPGTEARRGLETYIQGDPECAEIAERDNFVVDMTRKAEADDGNEA
jgi:hypothetical protein